MVKMMSNLVAKLSASDDAIHSIFKSVESLTQSINERRQKMNKMTVVAEDVKRCQQLALECGAAPDSRELYVCNNICRDPYNREFFCQLPSPEARMAFLKRWCQNHNIV